MSKKSGVAKFLGGALVGLGIGYLFAPKSGSETRKELADKMSDLWDKVRTLDAKEIKDNLTTKLNEIEKELRELDKEKVLNIAKEKSEMLKEKVEDLINDAKRASKPVIEEAANSVKKKLANVTREILKKLEDE